MRFVRESPPAPVAPVPPPPPLRVAVVDRDAGFVRDLASHARPLGWTLLVHSAPVTGVTLLDGLPDAILVDIDLLGPRWDAWLARHPLRIPSLGVLVCTERSTIAQRLRGLAVGADDWVTKPCEPSEVLARLHAIARRCKHDLRWRMLPVVGGELAVRPDRFDAFAAARAAGLTRREFDVLLCLARHRGSVVTRQEIQREVWGYAMVSGDRSIDTLVRRIRSKLRVVSPAWCYVHTHRGLGYRFSAEEIAGA